MKKRIVTIVVAALFAVGTGMVAAQSRGGGGGHGGGGTGGGGWSGGGGGWSGGGSHGGGGSWSGGGSRGSGGSWSGGGWRGGSGNWNGGGWHGGSGNWNGGGWHGGSNWNGGWRGGGWYGGRWYGGTNVGFYFGFPGTWWWPGWGWGGVWGWPGNSVQVVGTPAFVDQGSVVYIQRDQVTDGAYTSAPPARSAPANEFWHYCIDPPGYFPTVQQCNKEWLKVVPNNNSRPTEVPRYQ